MSRYDGDSGALDAKADAITLVEAALNEEWDQYRGLVDRCDGVEAGTLLAAVAQLCVLLAHAGDGNAQKTLDRVRLLMLEPEA